MTTKDSPHITHTPRNFPIPEPSGISVQFLLGRLIGLTGGLLRQSCYKYLGRFFTFEMGIHKDHKLITSGPYAVVRHPGYTGILLTLTGCTLVLNSCAWAPWPVWIAVWIVIGITLWLMFERIAKENEMLQKEFGDEWDRWQDPVRYRLVPWIF
ncbi:Isoprenylcysteine carboxyl methyltransferase family-domain-containing protein [Cyathus striatus]|nr:Isoprenylcysteine carboxyl methyltransferase family-domain-containing protein [Cyathus striatus]